MKKYDTLLQGVREFDNYWSDVGMDDAIALLEHFTDEDWAGLEKLLADRPPFWQVSCAETLSEITDPELGFPLLIKLLEVGNAEVRIAALDSINALASSGVDVAGKAPQLRNAIAEVRRGAGSAVSRMLNTLEQRLATA